jgi:hypothetical protein
MPQVRGYRNSQGKAGSGGIKIREAYNVNANLRGSDRKGAPMRNRFLKGQEFPRRFKAAFDASGLTQAQIAKEVGLSYTRLQRIINSSKATNRASMDCKEFAAIKAFCQKYDKEL